MIKVTMRNYCLLGSMQAAKGKALVGLFYASWKRRSCLKEAELFH